MKHIVRVVGIIALCVVAGAIIINRIGSRNHLPTPAAVQTATAKPSATATDSVLESSPAIAPASPAQPISLAQSTSESKSEPPTNASSTKPASAKKAKEPLKDPDARVALALVGADPDAEAYWFGAINDPNLPDHERQDLIEDLNEEGLSDPKNPSLNDLPLILRRLELIEALAPYAMDKVNLDAFEEAFKDLHNLAQLTVGAGQPVK